MQQLQDAITTHFQTMVESGKLDEIIATKVESLIEDALGDALRSYSDFGKAFKESLKGILTFDLDKMQIGKYNELVAEIVKTKLGDHLEGKWKDDFEAYLDTLLSGGPPEMKLSELLKELVRMNEDEAREEGHEYAKMEVGKSEYGTVDVAMWPWETDRYASRYTAPYRLRIDKEGRVWSIELGNEERDETPSPLELRSRWRFEAQLFRLRTAQTKVVIDVPAGEHTEGYEWVP